MGWFKKKEEVLKNEMFPVDVAGEITEDREVHEDECMCPDCCFDWNLYREYYDPLSGLKQADND